MAKKMVTLVEKVLKEITGCLERGETVKLASFGLFVVRDKPLGARGAVMADTVGAAAQGTTYQKGRRRLFAFIFGMRLARSPPSDGRSGPFPCCLCHGYPPVGVRRES